MHQMLALPLRVEWYSRLVNPNVHDDNRCSAIIEADLRGGNPHLTWGAEPSLENHRKSLGYYTGSRQLVEFLK